MNPIMAMITKLGAEAATKAAASPMMKLGSELAAGNVAGGIEGFAQNRFSPQMEFGRAMMDPNASGIDAFMKMRNDMPDSRPAPMQMAGIPQLQADPLAQMPTGSVGMQNQRRGMPMAQGLPQGLLAQLGYRG
jgi:hypothetical protein